MKLLLFIPLFLFARLNPFKPVINPENNIVVSPKYFKEIKVYLPKDARVLKKIIFVYQNFNGDIKKKEVEINKDIDFHSPIIVTHQIKDFNLKEVNLGVLKVYLKNKKIFIKTKDELIRNFFLVSPFRIILDFKKNTDFLTIKKELNSFVKKIVIGSHKGFYRVVFYFDAKYLYNIVKKEDGVLIELK